MQRLRTRRIEGAVRKECVGRSLAMRIAWVSGLEKMERSAANAAWLVGVSKLNAAAWVEMEGEQGWQRGDVFLDVDVPVALRSR